MLIYFIYDLFVEGTVPYYFLIFLYFLDFVIAGMEQALLANVVLQLLEDSFPRALLLGAEYLKCIDYLSGEQVNSNIFDVDVGPALRTYSPLFHIVFEALVTESMTTIQSHCIPIHVQADRTLEVL